MNWPVPHRRANEQANGAKVVRVTVLPLACWARAADGPLGAGAAGADAVALVVQMWRRARLPCCAPQRCSWAAGLMLRCGRKMRRRGRSNGCEWAPWAGSGKRAAGSNGG